MFTPTSILDDDYNPSFKASSYQEAFFRAVPDLINGDLKLESGAIANAIALNAVAGSGKSATLIELTKMLSQGVRDSTSMLAFNRSIANENQSKVPAGVTCKTVHSLAWFVLTQYLKRNPFVPDEKRGGKIDQKYIDLILPLLSAKNPEAKEGTLKALTTEYIKVVYLVMAELLDYSDTLKFMDLCDRHNIEVPDYDHLKETVSQAISAGMAALRAKKNLTTFAEVLYFVTVEPACLPLYKPFRLIMIDECQDISACMRQFLLNHAIRTTGMPHKTKFICVGDPFQAINGFAGADNNSYGNLTAATRAVILPLSISYRCSKAVVELVNETFPNIIFEPSPNAKEGSVTTIKVADVADRAEPGDMILCRTTYPLIDLCMKFLGKGKKAKVLGKDLTYPLKRIIKDILRTSNNEGGMDLPLLTSSEALKALLLDYYTVLSNKTRPDGTKKRVSEMTKENLGILLAIRDNNPLIKSFSDMEAYIEDFFKSDYISKDTIVLCTAHKAKGLQAKNVYIYHPDKLPYSHPKQQPWQFEQELNLQYVAYTRAMENLLFIEGKAESSNLLDLENAMEEGDL
jgi:hypothetical protein